MNDRWHRLLDQSGHRPWPAQERPWSITMCWHDLLFMHWPLPPETIARALPPGLEVDTFDGTAWIGVVPFRMTDIGLRRLGSAPWVSAFAELNVRTYVKHREHTGVWFFSLDAASRLAVETARQWFSLPYLYASIRCEELADGWIDYASLRRDRRGKPGQFRARYRPTDDPGRAGAGTLEHWLTERYCFFAADGRYRLSRTDVHHHPWPLQPAEVRVEANTMAEAAGIALPAQPPLLHFSKKLEVVSWTPVAL